MDVMPVIPGDPLLIDKIVCELKSQGIFDSFRKECIADVDTKPAYQNLRQRVEGSVTGFLKKQQWNPDMNKNQLREMLRKNIHESGFLETGVERIVDQVVNPKMNTVFLPKVTDVVYKYLGIERPASNEHQRRIGISIDNLLPEDLEAVSPESDRMNDSGNLDEDNDIKMDEDESPPFEPIDEVVNEDNNSVDSHLSGFSGLLSHDSNQSDGQRPLQIDMDTQMSKQSSDAQSTSNEDQNSKMEICEDSNLSKTFESSESDKNSKSCESEKTSENSSVKTGETDSEKCSGSVEAVETETIAKNEKDNSKIEENKETVKQSEGESDKSSSSIKDEKDKERKEKDNKDRKDRDRHRSSDKHKSRSDKKSDRRDKDKYSSKDRDRKDSRSRSERDKDKDKEKDRDRHRSSSKHDKSSSSSSRKESSSSSSSKNKSDSKDKHRDSSKSKLSSSSSKSDRHRKSSTSSSSKPDKSKDKDKKEKKYGKDDHYSSKHKSERRSTDRDSNDGSGLKSSSSSYCESNSSSQNSATQAGKAQDSSNSNSNSNDSGNSDSHEVINNGKNLIKPKTTSNHSEPKKSTKLQKEIKTKESISSIDIKQSKNDEIKMKVPKNKIKTREDAIKSEEFKEEVSPKTITPPLNRSVSMASWDAMEAMLNQNVNYDSYYDPEYTEDNNYIKDEKVVETSEKSEVTIECIEVKEGNFKTRSEGNKENDNNVNKDCTVNETVEENSKEQIKYGELMKESKGESDVCRSDNVEISMEVIGNGEKTINKEKTETTELNSKEEKMDFGKTRIEEINSLDTKTSDKNNLNQQSEKEVSESNSEIKTPNRKQKHYECNKDDDSQIMKKRLKLESADDEDLKYFPQQQIAELEFKLKKFMKYITLLRKEIADMETNIELNLCNNVPTLPTDLIGVNKENENQRNADMKYRKSTAGCESVKKIKDNNNFIEVTHPEEKFSLPLSPSDSDKSVERKTEQEPAEKKVKSQRYTSEDLYKPRPSIRHTSRRSRAKLE